MSDSIKGLPPSLQNLAIQETNREVKKDELGQTDFLDLMLTQMQNQDPLNPMESGDFLAQLAQFGTVNGITELNNSFSALADQLQSSQALQASTMVGRSVLIEGDTSRLTQGETLSAAVNLDSSVDNLRIEILDTSGQTIQQLNLGAQAPGRLNFTWDGKNSEGVDVASGQYRIRAIGTSAGDDYALGTMINARVESVTLGSNGEDPQLNLGPAGLVSISQVTEVR